MTAVLIDILKKENRFIKKSVKALNENDINEAKNILNEFEFSKNFFSSKSLRIYEQLKSL